MLSEQCYKHPLFVRHRTMRLNLFPQDSRIGFSELKPSADQTLVGAVRYRALESTDVVTSHLVCELDGHEANVTFSN